MRFRSRGGIGRPIARARSIHAARASWTFAPSSRSGLSRTLGKSGDQFIPQRAMTRRSRMCLTSAARAAADHNRRAKALLVPSLRRGIIPSIAGTRPRGSHGNPHAGGFIGTLGGLSLTGAGRRSFIARYEVLREGGDRRRPYVLGASPPDACEGTRMDIRFWGTRGSLAKPGRRRCATAATRRALRCGATTAR